MTWYLIVKYLHILAVAITIGGMFARQLVRGFAKRSADILQGASQNWSLVSSLSLRR